MQKSTFMHRAGAAAIASALALSAPPLFAQVAEEVPVTTTDTTTSLEPAVTTSVPADEPAPATVEAPAAASVSSTPKAIEEPAIRASAKRAPSAPAVAAAPVEPVVVPEPQESATPAAPPASTVEEEVLAKSQDTTSDFDSGAVAFGGALAILILSAGALGFARRRRREEEPDLVEVAVAPVQPARRHVEASQVLANDPPFRSAFQWGQTAPSHSPMSAMEQARRGPTPDNPSLSLKKRIKRAHFFEQRAKDAAAGRAVSVSRFAGLPERLVEKAKGSFVTTARPALQPA